MRRRILLLILLLGLVWMSLFLAGCGRETSYALYIGVQGEGSVDPASGTRFAKGTMVELTPVGQAGWVFKEWSGADCGQVASNPWRIVMDSDKHLTAVFVQVSHVLNVTAIGGGHVVQLLQGENTVLLTAVPDAGWKFVRWEGDASGTETAYLLTLDGDKNVTAVFEQLPFTLTVTVTGNGHVDKTPQAGNKVLLTAVPDEGWEFVRWEGDASGTETTYEVTLDGDKNVTAVFAEQTSPAAARLKRISTYNASGQITSTVDYQYDAQGRVTRFDLTLYPYTAYSSYAEFQYEPNRVICTNYYTSSDAANSRVIDDLVNGRVVTSTMYYPLASVYMITTYEYNADGTPNRVSVQYPATPTDNQYSMYAYSSGCVVITTYRAGDSVVVKTETQEYSGGRLARVTMTYSNASQNEYALYEYPDDLTEIKTRYRSSDGSRIGHSVTEYEYPLP